jgi:hypothetical protein
MRSRSPLFGWAIREGRFERFETAFLNSGRGGQYRILWVSEQ